MSWHLLKPYTGSINKIESTGEPAYNESAYNEFPFITNWFRLFLTFYFITYHANNELDSLITNLISQKYMILYYACYYEQPI